jgi:hypothetical protein
MNQPPIVVLPKQSPFTPGSPVPIELFVGRETQISEIQRFADQSTKGRLETIFLLGERGIGKSSVASFVRYLVSEKLNMFGTHVFLGRTSKVDDMVNQILEQLLKESKAQKWYNNITQLFGKYVEQVGLFDISIKFSPPKDQLNQLVNEFPLALSKFFEKIKDEKSGLLIALDDIDGLLVNSDFANWFKSFVDKVATSRIPFPVCIMLIGLPEQRDILANLQPSLMRVFRIIEINRLTNEEVKFFIKEAFDKVNLRVEEEAMNMLVRFSSGLPTIMHEIGDAVYWEDKDNKIGKDDVVAGIITAAENVCKKYLTPKVYQSIHSQHYKAILKKFGTRESWIPRSFKRKEIEENLSTDEKRVFGNFLRKMRELGVIQYDTGKGRGDYMFTNDLYPVCIHMKSME